MPNKQTDEEEGQAMFAEAERKNSVALLAFYYWERFQVLQAQGFTEAQAMEIVKTRGIMV
jgi:hypothetical protein